MPAEEKKNCNSVAWRRLFVKGKKTRSDTGRHLSCPEFILVFIIHGTLNSSKCLGSGGVWQPHGPGISSCDQFKRFVSETASRQKTLDPAAKQLHWVFHLKLVLSGNKQTTGGLFPPLGGLPVTAAEYWSVDGAEGRCEVKVWWRDSGGGAEGGGHWRTKEGISM